MERSIAIVSAMHKQIVECDKNHPKHAMMKPTAVILHPEFNAGDELEALVNALVQVGDTDKL